MLTREALARIAKAENDARQRYLQDIQPFHPTSPDFSFFEDAIERSLGRVIEHIAVYQREVIEANFREYLVEGPDAILKNDELRKHVFFRIASLVDELWLEYKTVLHLEPIIRESRRLTRLAKGGGAFAVTPEPRNYPQGKEWASIWRNLTEAALPRLEKRFDSTVVCAGTADLVRLVTEAGTGSHVQGRSAGTAVNTVAADLFDRIGSVGDLTRGGSIWRYLESRFHELIQQFGHRLVACWIEVSWIENGDQWSLADFQGNRERTLFEALAERAAKELGHSGGPKAVFYWLDILRAENRHFEDSAVTTGHTADGLASKVKSGTITRLLEASADQCLVLETRAAGQAGPVTQGVEQDGGGAAPEPVQSALLVIGDSASEDLVEHPASGSPPAKGNGALLKGKQLVNFATAERYLGITERQRQKLVDRGDLRTEGGGHNRKITTESLRAYLPPEDPN